MTSESRFSEADSKVTKKWLFLGLESPFTHFAHVTSRRTIWAFLSHFQILVFRPNFVDFHSFGLSGALRLRVQSKMVEDTVENRRPRLSRFWNALHLKGFNQVDYSTTIAQLSPPSSLELGGWELPFCQWGCKIGQEIGLLISFPISQRESRGASQGAPCKGWQLLR